MGKNTKIVGGILLVAIILVAVAYAAITNVELNINGVGSAQAKQENFKVEFIGTPSTSGKGTTTATISESDKTKGTVNVTGLTAKGDEATATYTVKNLSSDISADLTAEATSSNQTYFEVICSLEKTTLKAQEETTLKVTVRLLKTPIDATKEERARVIFTKQICNINRAGRVLKTWYETGQKERSITLSIQYVMDLSGRFWF